MGEKLGVEGKQNLCQFERLKLTGQTTREAVPQNNFDLVGGPRESDLPSLPYTCLLCPILCSRPAEIVAIFSEAGLSIVESGAVGISDLQFVLAAAPCCE